MQLGETPEKGSKEKPKRSSLTGGQTESTVTLEEAVKLLRPFVRGGLEPRFTHPDSRELVRDIFFRRIPGSRAAADRVQLFEALHDPHRDMIAAHSVRAG